MANINDYIKWRGDLPINKEYKLNILDSMVFSRVSYLELFKVKLNKKETIKSISDKVKDFKESDFLWKDDKELIKLLGESSRFKNLIISDYVNKEDKKIEKQFGALTIHLPNNELYISYIGTDNSIFGWKEDFNMGFMGYVPCQISGKEYLEMIAKKYPSKKIRIGGHSKGGNVAIFSAVTVSKDIQERIIKVDNFDGPGFNKQIIDNYFKGKIVNKIETFIPQESIIGRALYHKEKTTITLSNSKGLLEHDIYSWEVLKDDVIKSKNNTQISENLNNTFDVWIETTTPEQRKIFFESVFELLYGTEYETFSDIYKNLSVSIPKILKKYKNLTPEDRKITTHMIKILATTYLNNVKENQKEKHNNRKNKNRDK